MKIGAKSNKESKEIPDFTHHSLIKVTSIALTQLNEIGGHSGLIPYFS